MRQTRRNVHVSAAMRRCRRRRRQLCSCAVRICDWYLLGLRLGLSTERGDELGPNIRALHLQRATRYSQHNVPERLLQLAGCARACLLMQIRQTLASHWSQTVTWHWPRPPPAGGCPWSHCGTRRSTPSPALHSEPLSSPSDRRASALPATRAVPDQLQRLAPHNVVRGHFRPPVQHHAAQHRPGSSRINRPRTPTRISRGAASEGITVPKALEAAGARRSI